ncbi:SHOCT domain-containing protein [Paenibacillus darwinianus]|uniref:SHOCT domain-containing protein n=1 Tax=Paenibacillus darwinianus TaxID=1380763 RepID=UPI000ACA8AAF|nr:SHOCT domain-containing protein [Paenibacillus darwinianus]
MGCCGGSSSQHKKHPPVESSNNVTPLELLKIRLAKGEVTFEEYEKTKAALAN